jgi:hypothetical protein
MKNREELVKLGLDEFKADEVMLLESKMLETAVRFQFRKKDNSIRDANGTLRREVMVKEDGTLWEPFGESKPEPANVIRYWDLDAKSWRCFDVLRFIGICVA